MAKPTRDEVIDWVKKQNLDVDNFIDELDQYKTAHNKLTAGLKEAVAESIKYKRERDELIKDVEKLREEKNNLKHSVNDYKNTAEWYVANWQEYKALEHENRTLKSENIALRLQADEYFELWQNEKLTSQGLREQCKEYAQDASKYINLTEHIRNKALNNPSEHRYFRLVHFIDDLEADTHEG